MERYLLHYISCFNVLKLCNYIALFLFLSLFFLATDDIHKEVLFVYIWVSYYLLFLNNVHWCTHNFLIIVKCQLKMIPVNPAAFSFAFWKAKLNSAFLGIINCHGQFSRRWQAFHGSSFSNRWRLSCLFLGVLSLIHLLLEWQTKSLFVVVHRYFYWNLYCLSG